MTNYCNLPRRGNVAVMAVLFLTVIIAFTALVVDLGYIHNSRSELQRCADAAAIAACWQMGDEYASGNEQSEIDVNVRGESANYASFNQITNQSPGLAVDDVVLGTIDHSEISNRNATLDTSNPDDFNAVRVTVRRTSGVNGQVRTFFARVFGVNGVDMESSATAMILRNIRGFEVPSDGSNLDILPFALDEYTWLDLIGGIGTDGYSWNKQSKTVTSGGDGVLEVNLYPQGTGSPGNRGTVDIGPANNSTDDIARQIVYGVSPEDLDLLGQPLELDSDGTLILNGDTGISAGVKDELASIVGDTRIIPIFREVNGPGNNAEYTIVRWAGVRIMGVKLTGPMSKKHLTIQPAPISTKGVVTTSSSGYSDYVYSRAFLVQ